MTFHNDSLTVVLANECFETKPKFVREWTDLFEKYNISIQRINRNQILNNQDPKTEIKSKIQQFWVRKDLDEMKKSQQASLLAHILQDQNQYHLLPFWYHSDWSNSRRCLKALSGCDWLTPMKFSQPRYKCVGCQSPVSSRHLLFECNSRKICRIRERALQHIGNQFTNEAENLMRKAVQKCLPSTSDNLQSISHKKTEIIRLLQRTIFYGIGSQKLLIKFLKER